MSIRQWLTGLLWPALGLPTLAAVLLGVSIPPAITSVGAEAKTPGATYCFHGTCHRVKTLSETHSLIGKEELLHTSFYDDCSRDRYNPCGLTSSGEAFRPFAADNAASPIYPDGTLLLVRNPDNKETAVVRVNNAGPYWGKRKLDVSRGVAEKLGFKKHGVAKLEVRVIKAPRASEARYSRNRKYDAVPGYIGQFANADAANAGLMAYMALETATAGLLGDVSKMLVAEDAEAAPEAGVQVASVEAKPAPRVKRTRVASGRKAHGKRTYASARKGKTRYAAKSGKSRYAAYRGGHGKTKVAGWSRGQSRKMASAKRGHYGKGRYAKRHRAHSSKFASTNRGYRGRGKAARARGGKKYAAVHHRRRS